MITHAQTNHDINAHETKHKFHHSLERGDGMPIHEHHMMGNEHNMADMGNMETKNVAGMGYMQINDMADMDNMEMKDIADMGNMQMNNMAGMGNMQMNNMAGMGNMHKTFSLKTDSDFLIEGIKISSVQGIILALLFMLTITILSDSLKLLIHMCGMHKGDQNIVNIRKRFCRVVAQATSHMVSISFGYIIMLCVMTMNVWLIVAVVLGSGIAHFLIRPLLLCKLERHAENYVEETERETEALNHHNDSSSTKMENDNSNTRLLSENSC